MRFGAMQCLLGFGFPVRGGIAYDDFYVDEQASIFVGKALTRAYKLEQQQEWIGAAIDPSVAAGYPTLFSEGISRQLAACLFPEYDVPLKSGHIEKMHTLNWRWNLVAERGTLSFLGRPNEWSARRKVDAALQYVLYLKGRDLVYPSDDNLIPVEARRIYIGSGPAPQTPPVHGDEY